MRGREYFGLAFTLGITALIAAWPVIGGGGAAAREVTYTVLMFVALASSLNILLGYTGYVSFGHIVFYGFGGYVGFYLISQQGLPLYVGLLAGGLSAGLLAFLLGKAILHLRGAYFALATIGVNQAARAFVNNFQLFGGPTGLRMNFRVYDNYGGAMRALWVTYWVMVGITVAVIVVSYLVKNSKFGLGLMAIRENEDAAEVMGVVSPNAKTWAYVLSAIFPGMIGALFFFKNGTIEPHDAFRLHTSIEMLVMVMLGGYGTVLGPLLGAAGYQRLRGTLLVSPLFKNIQLAVAGALLLIIILFVPAGVIGWLRNRIPPLRRVLV
jgi:branched-chain amino acid transport system permease protein